MCVYENYNSPLVLTSSSKFFDSRLASIVPIIMVCDPNVMVPLSTLSPRPSSHTSLPNGSSGVLLQQRLAAKVPALQGHEHGFVVLIQAKVVKERGRNTGGNPLRLPPTFQGHAFDIGSNLRPEWPKSQSKRGQMAFRRSRSDNE